MAENQDDKKDIESAVNASIVTEAKELHVDSMSVSELHVDGFSELAALADSLESQNKAQLKAILQLAAQNRQKPRVDGNGNKKSISGAKHAQITPNPDITNITENTKNIQNNANSETKKTVTGSVTVRNGLAQSTATASKRKITVLSNPDKSTNDTKNTNYGLQPNNANLSTNQTKSPKSDYAPAESRKRRTIDLGAPESAVDAEKTPAKTETNPKPKKDKSSLAGGYYVDATGKLRRPDGKFASKIEIKRYSKEQNQNADEGNKKAGSNSESGMLAKAIGLLQNKAVQTVDTNAADAAGVAAGGSYWIAAKEIGSLASNLRDTFMGRKDKNEGDNKQTGIKSRIRSAVRYPAVLAGRVFGKGKDDSGKLKPIATSATPSQSESNYTAQEKTRADDQRTEKQTNVIETNHKETQVVLEEILDELKPKRKSLLDTILGAGKSLFGMRRRSGSGGVVREGRTGKAGKAEKTKKTTRVSRASKTADIEVDKTGKTSRSGRTTAKEGTTIAKGETTPSKKAALKSVADEGLSRDLPSKTAGKVKAGEAEGLTKKIPKIGGEIEGLAKEAPKVGGKAGLLKRPISAVSKVMAEIPKAIGAIPSVAAAGGLLTGKMAPVLSTVGGGIASAGKGLATAGKVTGGGLLSMGKTAASLSGKTVLAGARAVPLLGQALSVGLAGYDAYNGYNDTEAQKGIFNLKDGQQANTMQKSSTAAANVLDLGGLTSGLSSLLGDLAGLVGGKNTQEALTFDSGNMAKTMYDSVSGASARQAMGVKDGQSMTVGQKLSSGLASVLDLGGLTSFVSKGVGSIAEDLGVKGAKNATSFNAGSMANAIYSGTSSALGKLDFSSEDIVSSIDSLIDIVKKSVNADDSGSSIFNTVTNWHASPTSGPASNWSATAKGINVPAIVQQQQANSGLPDGYLGGVLGVESGGNPNAYNKSGASGLWQFMPKTVSAMGGFNPFDPIESTQKMIEFTQKNAAYFEKNMGRQASGRELYLMHQQGMGGGTNLLKNPDAPAYSVVGAKAVTQNGGDLNMSARQFAELQMSKFDRQVAANLATAKNTTTSGKGIPPLLARPDAAGVATDAKGVPPMLARRDTLATTSAAVNPATTKTVPTLLQRLPTTPVDIQKQRDADKAAEQATQQGPLVAKMDPAMTKSLSNIEDLLKQQGKSQSSSGSAGGNEQGRNQPVSDHDYVSGHMSDLVRDRG